MTGGLCLRPPFKTNLEPRQGSGNPSFSPKGCIAIGLVEIGFLEPEVSGRVRKHLRDEQTSCEHCQAQLGLLPFCPFGLSSFPLQPAKKKKKHKQLGTFWLAPCAASRGDAPQALLLFSDLAASSASADVRCFTAALDACAQGRQWRRAAALLARMRLGWGKTAGPRQGMATLKQ